MLPSLITASPCYLQKLFIGDGCGFQSFVTNTYRLHYFQSPSGIKFVLMTSPEHEDCKELLR